MRVIGRNIFSLGLSRITSGVVLFFVQARLAAYLGPHGFGKFSLVLAFQTMFLLFVDMGISRYVTKKISEDKSRAPAYYGNFLIAQALLAAIIFGIFNFVPRIFQYDAEVAQAMFFAAAGLFFTAMSIPSFTIIQAWQKMHVFAAMLFAESMLKAGWFMYAIWRGMGLVFIFKVYLLVGIFDIAAWFLLTRNLARPSLALDRKLVSTMFALGIPFAMLSGFEILIAKADSIIQKFFLSYADIGTYAVAYRFLDFLTFLPAVVALSLFPVFSEAKDLNTPEIRTTMRKINALMFAGALPLGLAITFFARNIILFMFGPEYDGAVRPFQILIWATVATLLYAVPNVIMQVKRTKLAIIILALSTAVNIIGNIIFIPRYGIIASAWLTVVSYGLVGVLYIYYGRKEVIHSHS